MAYPRNAASPPPVAIGAVVQISDGAVQTTGVTVYHRTSSTTESSGGGTTNVGATTGTIYYTPTQAETNYESFELVAFKSGCIPACVTVVTSASATAGVSVVPDTQKVDLNTIKTQTVTCAGGVTVPAATLASTTNITAASGVNLTATTGLGNQTANITGNLSGSVGSVTGAVGSVTGNVGGNVTGSVGSVVGAVGSVTGNVGGNVTGSVGSVAGAVGSVTAGVTVTTNNDKSGYSLATAPPTAAQVSTQVASDLASAHGAGAWTTATGFSTHSAADVVTALGTGSTLTALAPASTALSTAVWTNTKAGYIDAAISTAGGGSLTAAEIADAVWDELATGHIDTGKAGAQLWTVINTLSSGSAINIISTNTVIESE